MITTILNLYKRPEYLAEQIKAIRSQSIPSQEIWLWINETAENKDIDPKNWDVDRYFYSSKNAKYHGRFACGLLANTEYIAFFDDDTIPGKDWYKNCTDTIIHTPGILGGAGVSLLSSQYMHHHRMGWPTENERTVEVDLVGHAWFMKRAHLSYMWYETPISLDNGEDIQLSFLAQKYGNVKTYCPPHPAMYPEMWSSLKAEKYGTDNKASSNGSIMPFNLFCYQRDAVVKHALRNGWKTVFGVTC